jgi:hypothetical protein
MTSLEKKAIEVRDDGFGTLVTLDLQGLSWLLNAVYEKNLEGSTVSLDSLCHLADEVIVIKDKRELRLKAVVLETYDADTRDYVIFYLNGTPPKLLFGLLISISERMDLSRTDIPFQLDDNLGIHLVLSKEQVELLADGKTLKASCQ